MKLVFPSTLSFVSVLMLGATCARADLEWRVSIKLILGSDQQRPSGGDFDDPDEIRQRVEESNLIFASTGRGYALHAEIVELDDVSEWFERPARDELNRALLEIAARSEPARFAFRGDAINVYINNTSAGICSLPNTGEVILIGTNGKKSNLLHEIGHYFGLCHTQGCGCNKCDEDEGFVDCKTPTDDGIADTLPDLACWDRDEIAQNWFSKPYNDLDADDKRKVDDVRFNVMSYHRDLDRFTAGQMDRIADISNNERRHVVTGKTRFVDHSTSCGLQDGSPSCVGFDLNGPFDTLKKGVDAATDGDVVLVAGGSYRTVTLFTKPMVLRSWRGNVEIRAP